jgi:hypothetical protein
MRRTAPLVLLLLTVSLVAPSLMAGDVPCDCKGRVDALVSRIEANYIGYALGVKTAAKKAAWRKHVAAIRAKAAGTSEDDCVFTARELTDWFHDGHLFVLEAPDVTPEQAAKLAAEAEVIPKSESDIRAYLSANAAKLDPLEGIWYSNEGYRVGIIRDPKQGRRDFAAVFLTEGVTDWKPGQVKAEFTAMTPGMYGATLYVANHSPRHPLAEGRDTRTRTGAKIFRGVLLEMAPRTWGKEFPLLPQELGTLDPKDPRAPTLRALGGDTVVISIPSHSPEHHDPLEAMLKANEQAIVNAKTLIIDLRGDEGGSAGTTDPLAPYIYTGVEKKRAAAGNDDLPVVLSSPDNICYYQKGIEEHWAPPHLVERMKANPGKVVSYSDDGRSPWTYEKPVLAPKAPPHVALLLDDGIVSAGEAFILQAMKSPKVTLFGQNTAGCIDYQNVTMLPVGCPERRFYLGYPSIGGSGQLPKGGINHVGIPPDVRIPLGTADPIAFIREYYAKHDGNPSS